MTEVEKQYYKVKREIEYRACSALRTLIEAKELALNVHAIDCIAQAEHDIDMIIYELRKAENAIHEDTEKMLKDIAKENNAE